MSSNETSQIRCQRANDSLDLTWEDFWALQDLAAAVGFTFRRSSVVSEDFDSQHQWSWIDDEAAEGWAEALTRSLDDIPNHRCKEHPPRYGRRSPEDQTPAYCIRAEYVQPLEFWSGSRKTEVERAIQFLRPGAFNLFIDGGA